MAAAVHLVVDESAVDFVVLLDEIDTERKIAIMTTANRIISTKYQNLFMIYCL